MALRRSSTRAAGELAGQGMLADLRRSIGRAVLADTDLDEIEKRIIARAPIDEEQKATLWLYAEALSERRDRHMLTAEDFAEPDD